jgi:hypothetical protein
MTEFGFEEMCLTTPHTSYIEHSAGYVCSSLLENLGFVPTSQAKAKPRSFLWKAVRKGLRLVFVAPFALIASSVEAGPCMEAVFRKAPGTVDKKREMPSM